MTPQYKFNEATLHISSKSNWVNPIFSGSKRITVLVEIILACPALIVDKYKDL